MRSLGIVVLVGLALVSMGVYGEVVNKVYSADFEDEKIPDWITVKNMRLDTYKNLYNFSGGSYFSGHAIGVTETGRHTPVSGHAFINITNMEGIYKSNNFTFSYHFRSDFYANGNQETVLDAVHIVHINNTKGREIHYQFQGEYISDEQFGNGHTGLGFYGQYVNEHNHTELINNIHNDSRYMSEVDQIGLDMDMSVTIYNESGQAYMQLHSKLHMWFIGEGGHRSHVDYVNTSLFNLHINYTDIHGFNIDLTTYMCEIPVEPQGLYLDNITVEYEYNKTEGGVIPEFVIGAGVIAVVTAVVVIYLFYKRKLLLR